MYLRLAEGKTVLEMLQGNTMIALDCIARHGHTVSAKILCQCLLACSTRAQHKSSQNLTMDSSSTWKEMVTLCPSSGAELSPTESDCR